MVDELNGDYLRARGNARLNVGVNAAGQVRTNRVRVTVTYRWLPEMFLGGKTMTSTAEVAVAY